MFKVASRASSSVVGIEMDPICGAGDNSPARAIGTLAERDLYATCFCISSWVGGV